MLSNVSILPTTPVTTASLSSRTDNILLTSNKGKNNGKKCKRPGAYSTANMRPTSVARRNARERNRVRQVNNGFTALRDHLPYMPEDEEEVQNAKTAKDKKVSKVETLKRAVEYIKSLQRLLDERDGLCSPGAMSTSASSVPGGCLSPPGSYYNSPADGCHSPSAAPNASWTGHQQTTVGTPQTQSQQHRRHHQHQLYDLQSIGSSGEHHQTHVPGQQHQYVAHHQHHQQVAVFGHHQHPMSNHSSMSSLSPGAFSKPGSPTPSVSSDASSPVRLSKVKVEPQLDQLDNFQDSQQLNTSYAGSYDELTPLSPDDEELLDAIAWWQQN